MKKLIPFFGILVFLSLLVSCNSDASEGIFRQISQTTTPSDIVYTRLLGFDTSDTIMYFQTSEGIYSIVSSSSNASSQLVASVSGSLIKGSAYDKANDKIYVLTNDDNIFYKYNSDGTGKSEITVDSTTYTSLDLVSFTINNLYSNSMLVLEGEDSVGDDAYDVVSYDGTVNQIVGFTSKDVSGYSLDNFIMQTTKHDDGTQPIIISFADNSDEDDPAYLHYFVNPVSSNKKLISDLDTTRIANFYYDATNEVLYVLDYDGELFLYTGVDDSTDDDISSQDSLKDSSQDYTANAFLFPVYNTAGTELYLISKYSTKSSSLYVFTIDISSSTTSDYNCSDTNSISKGYADYLDASYIVSALETPSSTDAAPDLLVATRQNGIFQISILVDSADSNSTSNGDSSDSEEYSF
jgi:hypothetical protein